MEKTEREKEVDESTAAQDDRPQAPQLIAPLSTLSIVSGMASLLLLVLVVPALITGCIAIVCGHISLLQIKNRSNEMIGSGRARMGLLLGYGALLAAVLLTPFVDDGRLFVRGILASDRTTPAVDPDSLSNGMLGKIERKLTRGFLEKRGNTEAADDLANDARRQIKSLLREVLQLEDKKGFGWDESNVECYCHENSGFVFVVYVDDVEGFNDAALQMLYRASWLSSLDALRESEAASGTEWVVAVMGTQRCETFMQGRLPKAVADIVEPEFIESDAESLKTLLQ